MSAAFIPTNAADYEERTIKALPAEQACAMALLVLAGYKFNCGMLTNAGNRWWNVRDPDGKHMSATGGLALSDVVNRVWSHHDYKARYGSTPNATRLRGFPLPSPIWEGGST